MYQWYYHWTKTCSEQEPEPRLFQIYDSAMNVGNDRERADITVFAKDHQCVSVHTPKSTPARNQDHPGAESHAPQCPLHASPMTVEQALGVPIFTDFQNAFECIRSHGPDSCCIMGVKERWLIDCLKPTFHSTLWNLCDRIMEFGHMNATQHRYRLGVFPVPHGSVDFKAFPSSDPLIRAALGHGKVALCQTLCWSVFT